MSSTYIILFEFIDVRKALPSYIETQPEVEILELLVYIYIIYIATMPEAY